MPPINKNNKLCVGRSVEGREITVWQRGSDADKPWLLLVGGFHGDEPEGVYVLEKLLAQLNEGKNPQAAYNLLIIPCLNPDGYARHTRENARGVDLNRNYPTANFAAVSVNPHSGQASAGSPGSEPETQLMLQLAEKYKPARILSLHSDLHLVDYDGPAQDWAKAMSDITGYKLVESVGYPCSGSFGTWAGIERQIPLITLESWKAESAEDMEKIAGEILQAIYATIAKEI